MPTLKERIDTDLKDAMRGKKELELSVLRMLKSAVKYKEVEPGAQALDDAGVQKVIATLVKQRRDSMEEYNKANRPELAQKEEAEIAVLQTYLPQQLTPEQLEAEVNAVIAEVGATSPKDMGTVMKAVNPRVAGRAEGRLVSDAVKSALAKL